MNGPKNAKVSFGFKQVEPQEKTELVKNIFSRVASKYDIMNDAMSFFQHRLWKKQFVSKIFLYTSSRLLDVSCGSGDIAYLLYKKAKNKDFYLSPITLLDPNEDMLKQAKNRFIDKGLLKSFIYTLAPAEELPFEDNSFDIYTISFGLRNVTDRRKALKEAKRILAPNSTFYCLEFSRPKWPGLDTLYDLYSFKFIPRLGEYIANDKEAYEYLVESIRLFPSQKQLCKELEEAGFTQISYKNIAGGIAAIHIAHT